jgi:hypothetical protein
MFKKIIMGCVVMTVVLIMGSSAYARDIAGISLPETFTADKTALALNGAGVRVKFFMDMYAAGLYLKQKESNPQKILDADAPMAVRLHIVSSLITSEKMEEATRAGFHNSLQGNLAPLKNEIDDFINIFKAKVTKNDVYDFVYIPDKGMEVYKNRKLASVVKGLPFKKALFGIWLCDKPIQGNLKKAMLGQK